jgi:hypothetical protein
MIGTPCGAVCVEIPSAATLSVQWRQHENPRPNGARSHRQVTWPSTRFNTLVTSVLFVSSLAIFSLSLLHFPYSTKPHCALLNLFHSLHSLPFAHFLLDLFTDCTSLPPNPPFTHFTSLSSLTCFSFSSLSSHSAIHSPQTLSSLTSRSLSSSTLLPSLYLHQVLLKPKGHRPILTARTSPTTRVTRVAPRAIPLQHCRSHNYRTLMRKTAGWGVLGSRLRGSSNA